MLLDILVIGALVGAVVVLFAAPSTYPGPPKDVRAALAARRLPPTAEGGQWRPLLEKTLRDARIARWLPLPLAALLLVGAGHHLVTDGVTWTRALWLNVPVAVWMLAMAAAHQATIRKARALIAQLDG